ncbi:hypothetical protein [Arsukibacterium sp.]|uniref:hypothetical protein n=1 Tax=Arsukibacterium sp. TaxID=1977258 RepID=UPI002FD8CB37
MLLLVTVLAASVQLAHRQLQLFSFLSVTHRHVALRYRKSFPCSVDWKGCFAGVGNKLLSITSGKWQCLTLEV